MTALTFGKVNAIRCINVRFPSEADFQEGSLAVAECQLHASSTRAVTFSQAAGQRPAPPTELIRASLGQAV